MSQDNDPDKTADKILEKFAPAAKEIISDLKSNEVDPSTIASDDDIQKLSAFLESESPPKEITFQDISEKTGVELSRLTHGLLTLITSGKVIGFINDRSTPDPSDDILILREKRVIIKDDEDF